ncbi:calcium uniporter regulatory subunit MCUb, mitochondrial [Kryptolebias marmoratus]|uniref:Calcium uniporter regulatory subunit MCUb n=1 Tax=Kryptolebias marmoratus TaxID=37003 RepID=A0A3Q2ZFR0_KRYMA|nr:calcium uniporter regulatory subunit MCUb, mitochondrial [Kryptolebias marmoratus]
MAAAVRMMVLGKVGARLWGSVQPRRCGFGSARPVAFLHQVNLRPPQLRHCPALFYSTLPPSSDVSLKYKHGRLVLEVPLPSRNEKCLFFLRPMLMTVGDLIADLQREDSGVDASVFSKDGERVASTTLIDTLLGTDFQLIINNAVYDVHAPERVLPSSEHAGELEDMKHVVHLLHTALYQPKHHLLREMELLEKMDGLKQELSPLEKVKAQLSQTAKFHTSRALWTGMALLSVQGGALAWLTWWVYSWDVMEPVTYFITYATSMGAFAYYVLTKQDYVYPDARDRQFLRYFYKGARKKSFNVERYNELKDELAQVEEDLRRLRSPNQLQLPVEQIQPKP